MFKTIDGLARRLVGSLFVNMRRFLFRILSVGPIPNHEAFILDEHWRYSKQWSVVEGTGYGAGVLALMSMLKYCYELGVKYMTIHAFSIDYFRSSPEEVQYLMEKIEGLLKQESVINEYGVRIHFVGNMKLLDEPVRVAAEKAMQATANNTKSNLLICVACTSSDEIVHAVQASCQEKWNEIQELNANQSQNAEITEENLELDHVIKLVDIERHTYMGLAPDPDVLIRTSGPAISQTTTPFGTLYVFQDPLTLKANSNSKIVGTAEGTSVTSSLNGLQSISVAKITLKMKYYKGSISVVGGTHNTKPSNHPVVGGTGDFLFVQGYVTSSPVDLSGITVTFKIQFHLYWPPYAIPSHSK